MNKTYSGSTWGIWIAGIAATVGAAILNVLFLYIAKVVFDIEPRVPATFGGTDLAPLGAMQTIIATVVPGIIGTLMYWLCVRFVRWPNIVFGALAKIVFILSLFGPFMLDVTGPEQLVLCILHVIAACTIAGTLIAAGCSCMYCFLPGYDEYCDDDDCEECVVICDDCGDDCECEDCDCENCMCMVEGEEMGKENCECDCDHECNSDGVCCKEKERMHE